MFVCGMGNSCMYFTACKAKHEVKRPCGRSNPALGDYKEQPTVKPPKPPRKRSAPLYGELLNERELLKIENHNLKAKVKNLELDNDYLSRELERVIRDFTRTSFVESVKQWFCNRKGGGK